MIAAIFFGALRTPRHSLIEHRQFLYLYRTPETAKRVGRIADCRKCNAIDGPHADLNARSASAGMH